MKCFSMLLLFWAVSVAVMAEGANNDDVGSGDTLPNFTVLTNTGKTISSASLKGKPSFLLFFHTKCMDCRKELPHIQKIYEKYGEQMVFVAISRAQKEEEISEYWEKNGLSIPFAPQEEKTVFQLFARKQIPRIYICNSDGIITKTFVEKVKPKRLLRAVEKVLSVE